MTCSSRRPLIQASPIKQWLCKVNKLQWTRQGQFLRYSNLEGHIQPAAFITKQFPVVNSKSNGQLGCGPCKILPALKTQPLKIGNGKLEKFQLRASTKIKSALIIFIYQFKSTVHNDSMTAHISTMHIRTYQGSDVLVLPAPPLVYSAAEVVSEG